MRGAAKSALKLVTHVQKFPTKWWKRGRAGTAMGPMFGNSRACGPIDGKTRQFHGLLVGLNGCRLILPPRLVAGVCRCNLSVCSSSSLYLKCNRFAYHAFLWIWNDTLTHTRTHTLQFSLGAQQIHIEIQIQFPASWSCARPHLWINFTYTNLLAFPSLCVYVYLCVCVFFRQLIQPFSNFLTVVFCPLSLLQDLQSEIETHRVVYDRLDGTGRKLLGSLTSQEDAVMLQRRLDEMNQRWNNLKSKSIAIR